MCFFYEVGYIIGKYDNYIFRIFVFSVRIVIYVVLVMFILLVVFKVKGKVDSNLFV